MDIVKSRALVLEEAELLALLPVKATAKVKKGSRYFQDMAKLWSPFDRRVAISGIRHVVDGEEKVSTSPEGMADALRIHWMPTFAARSTSALDRQFLLERFAVPAGEVKFPQKEDMAAVVAGTMEKAPGPDGLRTSAWRACGPAAIDVLWRVFLQSAGGRFMHAAFNDHTLCFLSKVSSLECRPLLPSETRPLALKNGDSKFVAAVVARAVMPAMQCSSHSTQQGFIRGRNFVANVAEIDAAARIAHNVAIAAGIQRCAWENLPGILLYDYATAFPSVAVVFLIETLRARGLPDGFIQTVLVLYHSVFAISSADRRTVLFEVQSGVLQGCPASGALFTLLCDPLLRFLHAVAGASSLLRACADDLGQVFNALRIIKRMLPAFQRIAAASGLHLKPAKCVLILFGTYNSEETACLRRYVADIAPAWAGLKIARAGQYLGFWIGPAAALEQWKSPMRKYLDRAEAIALTGCNSAVASRLYASRAAPVLWYKGQLLHPPAALLKSERTAVHRLLHLPTHALAFGDFMALSTLGGPRLPSVKATCAAALLRFAAARPALWQDWWRKLEASGQDAASLRQFALGRAWSDEWDSDAIVKTLHLACEGAAWNLSLGQAALLKLDVRKANGIGVHKVAVLAFGGFWHPPDFVRLFKKRAATLVPGFDLVVDWKLQFGRVKKLGGHSAMMVIKTWANAWTTSDRMHEAERLPCVFGCSSLPDSLRHYLDCPRLWRALRQGGLLDEGSCALRLFSLRLEGMMSLVAAFLVYHQVRFGVAAQMESRRGRPDDCHLYLVSLFRVIDFANVCAMDASSIADADGVACLDRGVPVRLDGDGVVSLDRGIPVRLVGGQGSGH